jgi:hypothetical protein
VPTSSALPHQVRMQGIEVVYKFAKPSEAMAVLGWCSGWLLALLPCHQMLLCTRKACCANRAVRQCL